MAKNQAHVEAVRLRKSGKSITSIATRLGVSKSTVSIWCRDISLTEAQIREIASLSKHHATASLLRASELQRKRRQLDISVQTMKGVKSVGKVSKRDIFSVGLGLYWGEGYKKGSQELGFTNSDPSIIRFYIKWLENIYSVEKNRLILRVSINDLHLHRVTKIQQYWSKVCGVSEKQFTKASIIHTASKQRPGTEDEYQGTLRVKVRRGTELRRQILGSISALSEACN
jgi:transposase-like protein